MKRLRILLIFLMLLGTVMLFSFTAAAFTVGDVNCDGKIEVDDARLALRAALALEHYEPGDESFYAADVNFNEKLETGDARLILRHVVGLEQLQPRTTPVIPVLTKDAEAAVVSASKQCTVIIRNTRSENLVIDSYGIILDADGLVLTTSSAVFGAEKLEALTPEGEPLLIKEILAYNGCVVFLRLEGEFTAPRINTEYAAGDGVYYCRELLYGADQQKPASAVRRGVIYPQDAVSKEDWNTLTEMICMHPESVRENELPLGLPMMDADGAVLGIVCQGYNGDFRGAAIASCMELLKDSEPESVEEFCAQLNVIVITPSFSEATLFPGATAFCWFEIDGPNRKEIKYATDSDHIEVISHLDDVLSPYVLINVKRYGPDAIITFWAEGKALETAVTVKIHIADPEKDAALINYVGFNVPDFGAITGIPMSPSYIFSWTMYNRVVSFEFNYNVDGYAQLEDALSVFAYAAAQMGIEYRSVSENWVRIDLNTSMLKEQVFRFDNDFNTAHITLTLIYRLDGDSVVPEGVKINAYGRRILAAA